MEPEWSLCKANLNPNLMKIKYAIRGPLVERAAEIERELAMGIKKPFDRVIRANIGDPQALGQPPITFIRQVLALIVFPKLLDSPDFPSDVKERATEILNECTNGSVGSYTESAGLPCVRSRVAEYLTRRDGVAADPEDIYLGAGASELIRSVLSLLVCDDEGGKKPAVMIPRPQYPVFSGTLAELGITASYYQLDEDNQWAVTLEELERAWREAEREHCVRAIVVINPGNPTGQVLSREDVECITRFAHRRRLVILADEVYQENIISKPFYSFKKIVTELGPDYGTVCVASFLTASKGWSGECGARGGALELRGASGAARGALRAARALQHCPSVVSQAVIYCIMHPPAQGEASFGTFHRERANIAERLAERARHAHRFFNQLPGYSCNQIDGGMFAFPRVRVSAAARRAALAARLPLDHFYCRGLLEETGVCVVAGSGFGAGATASTAANTTASTAANTTASTAANTTASTAANTTASTAANTTASTAANTTASTAANTTASTAANTTASTAANTTASTAANTTASTAANTTASTAANTTASTAAADCTLHLRCTLLHTDAEFSAQLAAFSLFHAAFNARYPLDPTSETQEKTCLGNDPMTSRQNIW